GQSLAVVQQDLQEVQRRKLLVSFAHRQRLRRLDETARTLGVFLNIHVIPSACRPAPKARKQHLHWVSEGRVDVPQPAAGRRHHFRLASNVGTASPLRKRPAHKFVCGGEARRNLLKNPMTQTPSAEITGLYRYPVKGLTPEPLAK